VRTTSVDEAIAKITEQAKANPNGAIAFDGDGTLWSGDIGEDFFDAFVATGRIEEVARRALAVEAETERLDARGTGAEIAHRIHAAYLAGTFPEERVCEIMTWACAGWTRKDVDAFAVRVIEEIRLADRLHREAIEVVRHARSVGIDVYLVSASPRTIVDAAAHVVGIDPSFTIAATEACDAGGLVKPEVLRPIPYDKGKVTRLRERLGARTLLAAFGDNAFDVPMLREARHAFAIRPKQRLVDRFAEVPGITTLERL
jgi:phosphatidylglycerophosphatase C